MKKLGMIDFNLRMFDVGFFQVYYGFNCLVVNLGLGLVYGFCVC